MPPSCSWNVKRQNVVGPGTVADIVGRVRDELRKETEAARSETERERKTRVSEMADADRRHSQELGDRDKTYRTQLSTVVDQLAHERSRSEKLETSVSGIARILAWVITAPILGALVVAIAVVALFPMIGASSLPPALQLTLKLLTVFFGFTGGAFGLTALSLHSPMQRSIENRICAKLLPKSRLIEGAAKRLLPPDRDVS